MPIMTGYEATKAIRACEAERRKVYNIQDGIRSTTSSPFYSPMLSPSAFSPTSFPFPATAKSIPSQARSIDFHLNAVELKPVSPALIIALTGFSSKEDQDQAFESGVDVFMTKPVRFKEVGKILEGWMMTREKRERKSAIQQARNNAIGESEVTPLGATEVGVVVSGPSEQTGGVL